MSRRSAQGRALLPGHVGALNGPDGHHEDHEETKRLFVVFVRAVGAVAVATHVGWGSNKGNSENRANEQDRHEAFRVARDIPVKHGVRPF